MSVKIKGLKKLQDDLEAKLGPLKMRVISDAALTAAAKVFVTELQSQMDAVKDTGASVDEITLTPIYSERGTRTITVKWKGPKNRYRIIHLNEFGTVKNPNPKGKGAIARSLVNSEAAYKAAIKAVLKGAM